MARIHGVPGEWARVGGVVWSLWPLFLGAFVAGFGVALAIVWPLPGLVAFALAVTGCLLVWSRGLGHVESFFKGARGEERVSRILESLPDDYHVFNDFGSGRHRVDHVVVGPTGVFAIETKCWSGDVTVEDDHVLVNGRLPSREPLTQAVREAALVRGILAKAGWEGSVTPVLAFASDTFAAHRAEVRGTVVMNSSELRTSFETDRVVIPPAELTRLVSLMSNL